MSQEQIPLNSNHKLKLELYTWGSCKEAYADIIYPRYVSLTSITGEHGNHVIQLPLAIVEYENHDSRKNMNRKVTITANEKIAIRYRGATSCNPSARFDYIYVLEPGKEPVKLEPKIEYATVNDGKYIVEKKVYYVHVDDKKITFKEVELSRRKAKLTIYVKKSGELIEVSGDTYDIRDELKRAGFKWNPERKVWTGKSLPQINTKVPIEVIEQ